MEDGAFVDRKLARYINMSIALLLGAHAQRSTGGPVVRLRRGRYQIRTHGQVDSELSLSVDGYNQLCFDGMVIDVTGIPIEAQIGFHKNGSEESISVYVDEL